MAPMASIHHLANQCALADLKMNRLLASSGSVKLTSISLSI
jgi:hypothetical protein